MSDIPPSISDESSHRSSLRPDVVYASLRQAIITMDHQPGSSITETMVASRYQVARPTAKVAIQRLVDDGLLRGGAHRSAKVPELDASDVDDLYRARLAVEETALGLVAAGGVTPDQAIEAHEHLLAFATSDARAPFAHEDIAFHRALVLCSGSSRLRRMHDLIMGEIELCMGQLQYHHLMSAQTVVDEHQSILDAISIGDIALTEARTRAHILSARNRLLARFGPQDGTGVPARSHPLGR